jgi:hypothetical protein
MAQQPGWLFVQSPIWRGPARGDFTVAESGADADHGVVPGDGMAADGPEEAAEAPAGKVAAGFAGDEVTAILRREAKELAECLRFEVVKEEVGEHDIGAGVAGQPLEDISLDDFRSPAQRRKLSAGLVRDAGAAVHEDNVDGGPFGGERAGEARQKCAVAGTKFDEAGRGLVGKNPRERAVEDGYVAHDAIKALQIATRGNSPGVGGGQGIEPFWGKDSRHGGLIHLQERAVATEARAEGRQPPKAAGSAFAQGGSQGEENEGAAEVAELIKNLGAVPDRAIGQREVFLERFEDFATASVEDPFLDLRWSDARRSGDVAKTCLA